jgi:hypothetical protein
MGTPNFAHSGPISSAIGGPTTTKKISNIIKNKKEKTCVDVAKTLSTWKVF